MRCDGIFDCIAFYNIVRIYDICPIEIRISMQILIPLTCFFELERIKYMVMVQ